MAKNEKMHNSSCGRFGLRSNKWNCLPHRTDEMNDWIDAEIPCGNNSILSTETDWLFIEIICKRSPLSPISANNFLSHFVILCIFHQSRNDSSLLYRSVKNFVRFWRWWQNRFAPAMRSNVFVFSFYRLGTQQCRKDYVTWDIAISLFFSLK